MSEVIKELRNPNTETYRQFKELVTSNYFFWTNYPSTCGDLYNQVDGRVVDLGEDDYAFFSHSFLARPRTRTKNFFPYVESEYASLASHVVGEICVANNLKLLCIYRMNGNLVVYQGEGRRGPLHTDHEDNHKGVSFPHKIMLIYLTSFTDGATIVETKDGVEHYSEPAEDKIVTFDGSLRHTAYAPSGLNEQRIVLNATYFAVEQ